MFDPCQKCQKDDLSEEEKNKIEAKYCHPTTFVKIYLMNVSVFAGAVFAIVQLIFMAKSNLLSGNPLYVWFLTFTMIQALMMLPYSQ